jgi:gamma-glutamyltranspeptidase/glutathione hydrolase
MKKLLSILFLTSLFACNQNLNDNSQAVTAPRVLGNVSSKAMVVSAHQEASKVGVEIMKQGGNAFDAAIAVQFALAVVYPQAGNIGGGGFAVYRKADGEIGTLDFREKAPKAASKDMYLDDQGNVIKGLSVTGHKSYGVPGSVDGMVKLHEKYGSLPFSDLVQPSVNLAYDGVLLTEYQAQMLNKFKGVFIEQNGANAYLLKDTPWITGDTLYHKALAGTLAQIRDKGRAGFYEGIVADQIVKNAIRGNGLITYEDLKAYHSVWRTPIKTEYKSYDIISMPPPSSGGIALSQLFMGSARYDFGAMGHNTTETIHAMVELERRVYADRATFLGDPDFVDVPQKMLLSSSYNQKRFSDILPNKKTPSSVIKEGKVDIIESVETTHFSIIDKAGNAISITTTLNGSFGSKVLVKGAGFFMNNEMDDFSAKPGEANQYGLVGAEANAITPEKRMLSSMTPTIVLKNDSLFMVLGTPGGSTIITSVYQTILNVIDHGMTMQEAVNAPKFHHQWLPDVVLFEENRFDDKVLNKLEKMEHQLDYRKAFGKVESILVMKDGQLEGAADATRNPDSFAAGY